MTGSLRHPPKASQTPVPMPGIHVLMSPPAFCPKRDSSVANEWKHIEQQDNKNISTLQPFGSRDWVLLTTNQRTGWWSGLVLSSYRRLSLINNLRGQWRYPPCVTNHSFICTVNQLMTISGCQQINEQEDIKSPCVLYSLISAMIELIRTSPLTPMEKKRRY